MFFFVILIIGIEGMVVWNVIVVIVLCKVWYFKLCFINLEDIIIYYVMNSVCKDKILRYGVRLVVRKKIIIYCIVVICERKRENKGIFNFYWKGLKKVFRYSIFKGTLYK